MALTKRTKKPRPKVNDMGESRRFSEEEVPLITPPKEAPATNKETAKVAKNEQEQKSKPSTTNKDTTKTKNGTKTSSKRKKYANTSQVNSIDFRLNKKFDAKQRKTIKIDPDIKNLIEVFGHFTGLKEYEVLREMAQAYYEEKFDPRAQRIISTMLKNNGKH